VSDRSPNRTPWSAWAVHAYTATGALLAFFAAQAVFAGDLRSAYLWLFVAVWVDSTDGVLARLAHVHERLPHFSGQRLDDIVDYLTFVFVPALIVWRAALVPPSWLPVVAAVILLASAYGFVAEDAKTDDQFFTGFPSYWNIVTLYLVILRLPPHINAAILVALAALVFVRIGYVYPTRTPAWRTMTLTLGASWSALVLAMVVTLPAPAIWLVRASLIFPVYYVMLSLLLHARRPTR
jgi:phosphatidylcholine synthase